MELKSLAQNMTELTLSNGNSVLFSYSTPVAALVPGLGWLKTSTRYSNTTSRHCSKWFTGTTWTIVPQGVITAIADGHAYSPEDIAAIVATTK